MDKEKLLSVMKYVGTLWGGMGRHFNPGWLASTSLRGSGMNKVLMEVMGPAK